MSAIAEKSDTANKVVKDGKPVDADPVSNGEREEKYDIGEGIQAPRNQDEGTTRPVWFCKGNN